MRPSGSWLVSGPDKGGGSWETQAREWRVVLCSSAAACKSIWRCLLRYDTSAVAAESNASQGVRIQRRNLQQGEEDMRLVFGVMIVYPKMLWGGQGPGNVPMLSLSCRSPPISMLPHPCR